MKNIPYILIASRFAAALIILYLGYCIGEGARGYIVGLMYFGIFTDVFDGIIARKTGVSSEKLRRLDSQTDLIFWLSLGWISYQLNSELIKGEWKSILFIFIMEASCYIISIWKFGKETCTHAFLAKIWGLSLLLAFTYLIGFQETGWPFYLSVTLGLISHIDVILIILILPQWRYDVPSCYHAWMIRKGKKRRKTIFFN
ncbi:CDP-alcohol phosphatidyltransferase family protein [Chryseobacterium rhizosphaerae]|uniref:CDP-alcohol phosphatidyltransferase family protein n=1 Tax=Chryseobacterium rhizosphaerae TaxID=395937 RepID=UPI003D10F48E